MALAETAQPQPSAARPQVRKPAEASIGKIDNRAPLSIAAIAAANALPPRKITAGRIALLLRLADAAFIAASGYLAYRLSAGTYAPAAPPHYIVPLALVPLVFLFASGQSGNYDVYALRAVLPRISQAMSAWISMFGAFALAAFFLKLGDEFSRLWLATWFGTGLAGLIVIRLIAARQARRWAAAGHLARRAVIVGSGPEAADLITALEADPDADVHIHGVFDDRLVGRNGPAIAGCQRLGTIDDLIAFARKADIDLVLVALPLSAESRLANLLNRLWVLPVDIRISARATPLRLRPRSFSHIGTVPFLDVFDRPIAGGDFVAKRLFDLVVASLAVVALAPLMLAVALLVRLDSPGPVLFRQKRYGFNNNVISVLKFRSMYHHMADPGARVVVTRADPRVTRVGRFLRRSSLDELPQLFNVLRGDLSLVGPRPHAINAHTDNEPWDRVVDGYFARHRVRPGVTGWAQVNGWRGEVDCAEKIRHRVDHDLHYIENWSILFDLYILALTPLRLLSPQGAY